MIASPPRRSPRLAAPLLLALVALASACTGKYVRSTTQEPVAPSPERLARGAYLVGSVAACGSCHTTRESGRLADPELRDALLAGGNVLETSSPKMRIWVPNVTSDPDTGVGGWSDDQLARAIRDGVDEHGDFLSPVMPFGAFRHLSDEDVRAVVAYLRSVPKVRQDRKPVKNEVPFFVHVGLDWFGAGRHGPAKGVQAPPPADRAAYGSYLFEVAGCADCHSLGKRGPRGHDDRWLAGSDVPFPEGGKVWASNLTPDPETGIGRFTPGQVRQAIKDGLRLDGKKLAPPMDDLARHYARMTDDDLDAIVLHLYSVKPVKHAVSPRQLDAATAARLGGP
jgi:mono/diheme cytochrome c family protein